MTERIDEKLFAADNLPPRIELYGSSVLKEKATKVDIENENIEILNAQLVKMVAAMYFYGGIGLAAPQINIMKRILVWDNKWIQTKEKYKYFHIMINPEIIDKSVEDIALYENCLSIPEVEGSVYRPKEITVKYINSEFQVVEEKFDGLDARIIQHKIDHLDGVLFVNKMTAYERDMVVPMLTALRQAHDKYNEELNIQGDR